MDVTDPHSTARLLRLSPDSCLLNGKTEFLFGKKKKSVVVEQHSPPLESAWLTGSGSVSSGVCSAFTADLARTRWQQNGYLKWSIHLVILCKSEVSFANQIIAARCTESQESSYSTLRYWGHTTLCRWAYVWLTSFVVTLSNFAWWGSGSFISKTKTLMTTIWVSNIALSL